MPETLNETWAAQILDEHRDLRAKVQELRGFLDRPRPSVGEVGAHTWAVALAERLLALHDQLVRHFRFEEEGGLQETMSLRHPEVARAFDEVLDDHPAILSRLRELLTGTLIYSEGQTPSDEALRRRVHKLLDYLGSHERRETALIQKVEYRDLGVGD